MERCVLHIKFEYIIYVYIYFLCWTLKPQGHKYRNIRNTQIQQHIFFTFLYVHNKRKKSQTNDECLRKNINSYE